MWNIIQKGGPLMYLIILCSIVALAVVIERLYHLHRARIDIDKFMEKIATALKHNRIMDAIELCEKTPGPVAHVVKAGILKHDRSRADIKEAIDDAGIYEVPRLEKNLGALATIAHISPLLGLLGTVTGMVRAFQIIQEKASAMHLVSPANLAGGIWEALVTTAAGLIVAIPTFVAYNYLVSRVKTFIVDMERSSTELIGILAQRGEEY